MAALINLFDRSEYDFSQFSESADSLDQARLHYAKYLLQQAAQVLESVPNSDPRFTWLIDDMVEMIEHPGSGDSLDDDLIVGE
jgi:hypothetical protein